MYQKTPTHPLCSLCWIDYEQVLKQDYTEHLESDNHKRQAALWAGRYKNIDDEFLVLREKEAAKRLQK